MAAMTAEAQDYTDEFFAEISKGRKFSVKTKDGRDVLLHLHDPDALDIGRAANLFDHLKAGVDKDTVRETLVRLVCLSCIHGVDDHNVSAFVHAFPPVPKIIVEGLRLLEVNDDQMRDVGINPEGGLIGRPPRTDPFRSPS